MITEEISLQALSFTQEIFARHPDLVELLLEVKRKVKQPEVEVTVPGEFVPE